MLNIRHYCLFILAIDQEPRTECNTRSIFKLSMTGLCSEPPFHVTGHYIKHKQPNLPNYLSNSWIHKFPNVISTICNAI